MVSYCAWGSPLGPSSIATVSLGASATINFGFPSFYTPPITGPVPVPWGSLSTSFWLRISAYGSRHTGGANFALADGSARFISQTIPLATFQALATRRGGESITGDY
jgi:prepilin-type processing-associated H-X9-DG protein